LNTAAIPTQTAVWNGVTFIIEQESGWSFSDCQLVCNKLASVGAYNPANERERNRAVRFAEAITQTVSVDGDPGFVWPTAESSAENLALAFAAIGTRKGLMSTLALALQQVEALTPGDKELKKEPPPQTSGEPSESPSMSGSPGDEPQPTN
jgi:hypothetical protein